MLVPVCGQTDWQNMQTEMRTLSGSFNYGHTRSNKTQWVATATLRGHFNRLLWAISSGPLLHGYRWRLQSVPDCQPVKNNIKGEPAIPQLETVFAMFRIPSVMRTDNGAHFQWHVIAEFAKQEHTPQEDNNSAPTAKSGQKLQSCRTEHCFTIKQVPA